nr:hypothetical protein [Tanacetum cinerariifolium]
MEDLDAATESSGTLSAVKKSSLHFDNENPASSMTEAAPEAREEEVTAWNPVSYEIPTETMATMDVQDTRSVESAGLGKGRQGCDQGACKVFGCLLGNVMEELQVLQNETSDLKTLLEAETDLEKATKTKNADLTKELEREEKLKAAFEEFKKYEDDRVETRCAEMDAHLDELSIDFDEKLYPCMLTAIASHRWVIRHGLRLAVIKCGESAKLRQVFVDVVSVGIAKGMSEGPKYRVDHGKANLDLKAIEVYDPEVETKYVATLHALRDLKYPMVDQLELLKDAPIDVVMSSLLLESDSRKDAPQWIRELRPSSSQLTIPKDPWAFRKRYYWRLPLRLMSDGVPVLVPTTPLQGLAILLVDTATQTETSKDGASPRLLRSNSLPVMYNLD